MALFHPFGWGSNLGDIYGWEGNRDFQRYSPRADIYGGRGDFGALTTGFRPSVDVRDTGKEIVVHAELPGVPKENVNVEIRDNNLMISGETTSEDEHQEWNGLVRERRFGRFMRQIPLPAGIDAGKVQAKFDKGVLEITSSASNTNTTYTVGDLFCGAGGFSCGAKTENFQIKWAVDIDADACITFQANHSSALVFNENVKTFLNRLSDQWFRVDVLLASPPCQGFSSANTRGTQQSRAEQNNILLYSIEAIKKINPKIIVMENVVGFHTKKESEEITTTFYKNLVDLGYDFETNYLVASNYGVPQKRKRFFLLGVKKNQIKPSWPKPTHFIWNKCSIKTRLKLLEEGLKRTPTIREAFAGLPEDLRSTRSRFSNIFNIFDYQKTQPTYMTQLKWDDISMTVLASLNPGWKCIHPSRWRYISVREQCRLQGFPDDYEILGESIKSMYKQVGNAVPPLLASALLKEVKHILNSSTATEIIVIDD
ncbi:2191_t:CDS:10 [Ambispora gerdemannii]|uniref:Cytosine-specific methyltransferase n=1 Tax=Ambispora gerdemannii TaxID=144530 RepID=A0A9N9FVV5_9GLOM|nr:2191_t:CDS:10 [Ambispora gerdemannii]